MRELKLMLGFLFTGLTLGGGITVFVMSLPDAHPSLCNGNTDWGTFLTAAVFLGGLTAYVFLSEK